MAQVILYNVTNGLMLGAFYVLMALGLSLILNLSNVINFAHGNFLAFGAYMALELAFVMQGLMLWWWGPSPQEMHMVPALEAPVSADLFFITWYRVFMVAIVIVTVIAVFAFLRYTRVGLRIRAGTLDLDTVAALGVNVKLLRTFNFTMGCLLAGLSGVLATGAIG